MIRFAAKFLALFIVVQIAARVASQPIPRTQWEDISFGQQITFDQPQVATFSDGSYIVVFVISGESDSATGTIFNADGTVSVWNFVLPDNSATSSVAPRVIIFSDDTFLTAWRDTYLQEIHAKMWDRNGTALTYQFRISMGSVPPRSVEDSIEMVVMPNDHWIFAYVGSNGHISVQLFDTKQSFTSDFYYFAAPSVTRLSLAGSFSENSVYLIFEGSAGRLNFYQISANFSEGYTTTTLNEVNYPQRPFATVMSSGNVPVFWETVIGNNIVPTSIGISLIRAGFTDLYSSIAVVNNQLDSEEATNTMAVDLGNDRLLTVYQSTYNNVTTPTYRVVLVATNDQGFDRAFPLGPEVFDDSAIIMPFLMAGPGSDIIVIAINSTGGAIVRRVLTFCGNSAVELREQCDGTEFCTDGCLCEQGFVSVNGRCVPDCGDGVVVGSEQCDSSTDSSCDNSKCVCAAGYIPIVPRQNGCTLQPSTFRPSVGPTLDCVGRNPSRTAHFSFLNEDGFTQTIPLGLLNQFTPSTLAVNRPTQFDAGASLTFPSAPFKVDLPAELQSFTWILGQFNLTVDLSNISALYCPRDVSFVVRLVASDVLTEELVQIFLNNFAGRYGISSSRLTATVVLNNPGPAERRRSVQQAMTLYDYTVTVTVAPSDSESSSEDVVDNFLTEYKNTTLQEEINNELTEGLESVNPQIKEITPAPTGVSVRSERFDAPTTPAPVAENPPKAVSQPVKLSSASILGSTCQSLVFLFVLILAL